MAVAASLGVERTEAPSTLLVVAAMRFRGVAAGCARSPRGVGLFVGMALAGAAATALSLVAKNPISLNIEDLAAFATALFAIELGLRGNHLPPAGSALPSRTLVRQVGGFLLTTTSGAKAQGPLARMGIETRRAGAALAKRAVAQRPVLASFPRPRSR